MTELWEADEAFVRGARRLSTRDEDLLDRVHDIAEGKVRVDAPLALFQVEGRKFTDWVGTDFGLVVVSPRLIATLRAIGATGWSTLPITVDADGWDGYAGLIVTGIASPVDRTRSIATWSQAKPGTRSMPIYKGLGIKTTDGSDLVIPRDSAFILVSHRVRDALSDMTNVQLVREDTIELPRYQD